MMITPLLGGPGRPKAGNDCSREKLAIDYDTRTATCPQGQKSATWNHAVYDRTEKIYITSRGGPVGRVTPKPECTTSKAPQRGLTIYPRELHEIQQAASTAQNTKS